jgi:hypothetical protein
MKRHPKLPIETYHALDLLKSIREHVESLTLNDTTMTYGELAQAIGMGPWQPSYRQSLKGLLNICSAIDRITGDYRVLDYWRVVNAGTGKPGAGCFTPISLMMGDDEDTQERREHFERTGEFS